MKITDLIETLENTLSEKTEQENKVKAAGGDESYYQMARELVEKYPSEMGLFTSVRDHALPNDEIYMLYKLLEILPESMVDFAIKTIEIAVTITLLELRAIKEKRFPKVEEAQTDEKKEL